VAAKNCFTGSLQQSKNKVAFRKLSMVLRQLGDDVIQKSANVSDSVKYGKEAIACDVTDGISWYVYGNAYLAQFFVNSQNYADLDNALKAYCQAEHCKNAKFHPDMFYNRAVVYQYQQDYQSAISGFTQAAQLDPLFQEPTKIIQQIITYLDKIVEDIINKANLKDKRLSSLVSAIQRDVGFTESEKKIIGIQSLKEGKNDGTWTHVNIILNRSPSYEVPQTYVVVDHCGYVAALSIYNIAKGAVKIGDTVSIPNPVLQNVSVNWENKLYQYLNIKVDKPQILIVNGKKAVGDNVVVNPTVVIENKT